MRFLAKGNRSLFDVSVEEQQAFLKSLGLPNDDIERSYKQYLCQNYFIPKWKRAAYNLLASIAFPFIVVVNFIRGLLVRKATSVDAIGEFKGLEEVIPDEISEKYSIDNSLWFDGDALSISDLLFIVKMIVRYPLSSYFVLKCTVKISKYSYMITRHTPRAFVVHNEYSFTSSVLTAYCHCRNVKHINAMHGEKLYFIRESFFRYDRCYVWNEHYRKLTISLMAEPSQFVIAIPPSMRIDCERYHKQECYADYKYYLTIFDETQIQSIVTSMEFVKRQGKTIKYRPHPRHSDMALLEKYVDSKIIESPNEIDILTSIANLSYAIGCYTTVLNQAFHANKGIILDDVTFHDLYIKLKERYYILGGYDGMRLSQFQINLNNELS